MYIFTDCSLSPETGFGIGAFFSVQDLGVPTKSLSENIRSEPFERVTSTELELRTLLWAIDECKYAARKATVFTDSQNITGLTDRRYRLEKSNFLNARGDRLKLADLYEEYFRLLDEYAFDVCKVRGHSRKSERREIERLFSFLDRRVRKKLRESAR